MNKHWILRLTLLPLVFLMTGCTDAAIGIWEETKTLTRYIMNGGRSLVGRPTESKVVTSRYEFYHHDQDEFIPLEEEDVHSQYIDFTTPQPRLSPGDKNSPIPGIQSFSAPSHFLSHIFQRVHFNTDQHVVHSQDDYKILHKVAAYLKSHPNTYIFVCGHCDERAGEAYNLALGTRRSNFVRQMLIKDGVNPEQLYSISYGKEQPLENKHNKEAWAVNRRVEFKIYDNTKPL